MTFQFNPDQWFGVVLCLLPVVYVVVYIIRKRKEQRGLSLAPFTDLIRRPAGETLRLKLEELEERLTELNLGLVSFPMLMALWMFMVPPKGGVMPIVYFLFSAGSSAFFGIRLYKVIRSKANYRLGYEGERFVGEELSRLIAAGFEIYHDVPFDGFNIDHVLVGRRGVYVVETKAWRQPLYKSGKAKFKAKFDGEVLEFPDHYDTRAVKQAKGNAKKLSDWVKLAAGENVWITPILTFPGWRVDTTVPNTKIYVLNPEQIVDFCSKEAEMLSDSQIKGICNQLDQKCRIRVT